MCNKWRYLDYIHDPTQIETEWCCAMNLKYSNSNVNFNNGLDNPCNELSDFNPSINENDDQYVYTNFSVGSIVWAKLAG